VGLVIVRKHQSARRSRTPTRWRLIASPAMDWLPAVSPDVRAANLASRCVLRLPNGRDGTVEVGDGGSVPVDSGTQPFDVELDLG
jgi:hypothetical protein